MCGVAGWVNFRRDISAERDVITSMTAALACRGPDDGGVWLDRHVALGHRRLSIIDLESGGQPMVAEAGGRTLAAITYGSEVYNFRELRAELEAFGHRFRTTSDTEVVLTAYLRWGDDFVDRLNGVYAFGIWDAVAERLLLVRDRFGVKPLYYSQTADGVVFGSEYKSLLAHPLVDPVVDCDGLRELFSGAKTPGVGVYANVSEVRPGEVIAISAAGLTRRQYWRLPAWEHTDDLAATVRTVRELLEDIVDRQLVSDVPVCTLLSGGLDSSAITALAARRLAARGAGPLRTVALDFTGYVANFQPDFMRDAPDGPFVHDVAAHLGTRHTDVVLSSADLADPLARAAVLAAFDLPYGRGDRDVSLYLLCRAASRDATVALGGESADEFFGGYAWFADPGKAQPAFPWLAMFGHAAADGADPAVGLLDPRLRKHLDLPSYRGDRYAQALAEVEHVAGQSGRERRMRELSFLALTRLMPLLLDRADRLSMAAALELRVPFLDHRLVEYVYNAPWSMKTFDGREKSLLRAACRDLLPESVRNRRKAPFPATQDAGYERRLRASLAEILADPSAPVLPYLDREQAALAASAPQETMSTNEARTRLELVLALNTWLERYRVQVNLDGL